MTRMKLTTTLFFGLILFCLSCAAHEKGSNYYADGQALQVIQVIDGRFVVNKANLETVCSGIDPETEVAVIAIGGEYRKGKSFLMNFFLQYLSQRQLQEQRILPHNQQDFAARVWNSSHPWLRDMDRNSGFQFRSGRVRHTTGIVLWSKPFIITKGNGRKLAILLMDSQGLGDKSTSQDDNIRIFTMVSLLSSSLMMNIQSNVNIKHLIELKYFMDYATTASKLVEGHKPFQRLTFLIRDYTLEPKFGWEGGKDEINQFMVPHPDQDSDVRELAVNLTKGFEKIDGFTLPFPGKEVTNKNYNGSLRVIDPEFLCNLENLVFNMSEGAEARTPLMIPLTGGSFVNYVHTVTEMFNNQSSPEELMRTSVPVPRQSRGSAFNELKCP